MTVGPAAGGVASIPAVEAEAKSGVRLTAGAGLQAVSLLALVALWQVVAVQAGSRSLPPPLAVLRFVVAEGARGDLFTNIGMTLWRSFAAFAIAMVLGTGLGILLGRVRWLDLAFGGWVTLLLNTPALVITVLCFLFLGLTEAAAITAVALNKMPSVLVIVRQGMQARDIGLDELGLVYRFTRLNALRHILLPQLVPYLMAAARSGLALVWKVVLLVELLGRPNGVGFAVSTAFQLFDIKAVLGYSLSFAAVMLVIEHLVLQPLEAGARRWRRA